MTVCIAALANESKTIVCCADKAMTYDDNVQWDSDCDKIIEINPSGTICMAAGDDESIFRVIRRLGTKPEFGATLEASIGACEAAYQEALQDEVEAVFLKPRMLSRADYITGITGGSINEYMLSLAKSIDDFEMCDLILAGFTKDKEPYLLEVTETGQAEDCKNAGSTAIGSGAEKAISRLLWAETKRIHSIERVLWDVFDAKANAEMAVGVGYEWDAAIILPGRVVRVEEKIKKLIERAWSQHNRSPFDKHNPKEDLDLPPQNWRSQLHNWVNSISTDSETQDVAEEDETK